MISGGEETKGHRRQDIEQHLPISEISQQSYYSRTKGMCSTMQREIKKSVRSQQVRASKSGMIQVGAFVLKKGENNREVSQWTGRAVPLSGLFAQAGCR